MDNNKAEHQLEVRPTFTTPYSQYADREGEPFALLSTITDPAVVDPEVAPLYRIRFADGTEIDAWPEEVTI